MKSIIKKLRGIISNNYKLLIGAAVGILITLPIAAYAVTNHNEQNKSVIQNQPVIKQSSDQDKSSENSASTPSSTPNSSNHTNPQSTSVISPSSGTPKATTPTAPTLLNCTNNNDVPYETHVLYGNSLSHIPGVNGWSKNCMYSDGHSTKETYTQPVSGYYYINFYTPTDSDYARNQCIQVVGITSTQLVDECVTVATTPH